MKPNTICWLLLLGLTVAGVAASEILCGRPLVGLIFTAAFAKLVLVGWRYMELHAAHGLWKSAFVVMIIGLLGLLYGLA